MAWRYRDIAWRQVSLRHRPRTFPVMSGRKVIVMVSRSLSKASSIEDLAAQTTSACVIFTAAVAGVPLSTSTVVTASMVGAGLAGRRHHIHWRGVVWTVVSWLSTVPVCAALSAGVFDLYRTATRSAQTTKVPPANRGTGKVEGHSTNTSSGRRPRSWGCSNESHSHP